MGTGSHQRPPLCVSGITDEGRRIGRTDEMTAEGKGSSYRGRMVSMDRYGVGRSDHLSLEIPTSH